MNCQCVLVSQSEYLGLVWVRYLERGIGGVRIEKENVNPTVPFLYGGFRIEDSLRNSIVVYDRYN